MPNLKKQLLENAVKPLARRLGTLMAGVAAGVTVLEPDQFSQVETCVTMSFLIAVDLVFSAISRRGLF